MAAKISFKTANIAKANGLFVFNAQDKDGRPAAETFKSVEFQPDNATGEYRVVDIGNYYWLRGTLNACADFFFGSYDLADGMHRYIPNNPKRKTSSWGWIRRDTLDLPANGSPMVHTNVVIDGNIYDVELPHRKLNGKAVVNVETIWLSVSQMSDHALALKNSRVDAVSGKDFGFIKHEAMNDLVKGLTFKIPTTIQTYYGAKNDDGSPVLMDAMQQKAKWLFDLIEKSKVDFAGARDEFWASKSAIAANQQIRKEVERFDKANGGRPTTETLKEMTVSLKITVKRLDGSIVTLTPAEMSGFYRVVSMVNEKINDKQIIAAVFDSSRQSPLPICRARSGNVAFVELATSRK